MKHKIILPVIFALSILMAGQPFSRVISAIENSSTELSVILQNAPLISYLDAGETSGQADTAASSVHEPNLKVFPNPATDFIRIEWQASGRMRIQAELFDLFGRKITVEETETSGNHIQLDVRSLQRSAYLLRITSSDEKFSRTYRIIKY